MSARSSNGRLWLACSLALVFLGLNAFTLHGLPLWNTHSDQVIYLTDAQRMLQGEHLYTDIFQILPPGTELAYMAAITLFGIKAWIPAAMYVLIGLIQLLAVIKIADRLCTPWMSVAVALCYLASAYQDADVVHHWFSTTWLLIAVAIVIERRSIRRLVACGIALGFASATTPARGLLGCAALAAFLFDEEWLLRKDVRSALRKCLTLIVAYVASFAAVLAPFVHTVGWRRLWYCTVVYVRERFFLDDRYNNWTHTWTQLHDLTSPPFYLGGLLDLAMFLVPVLLLLAVVHVARYWRQRERWPAFTLLVLVGVLQLVAVVPYPSILRLASISAFAFVSVAALIERAPTARRSVLAAAVPFVAFVMLVEPIRLAQRPTYDFVSRIGPVAFRSEALRAPYAWLQRASHPGDFVFDAGAPDFYYLLGLKNATAYPFVAPNAYTTDDQVADIVGALERRRARFVIWPAHQMAPMASDPLGPLRQHLKDCYHEAANFPERSYEMWQRDTQWSAEDCRPAR